MYEQDELYKYLTQKKKDFDSLLSSADGKLIELESKSSRVSIPLNFHFFLRIRFGRRYKKLDERLMNAESIYEELARKQRLMKPNFNVTDPTVKNVLEIREMLENSYQDARSLVDLLDDIEKQLDNLSNRIPKARFESGVNPFN